MHGLLLDWMLQQSMLDARPRLSGVARQTRDTAACVPVVHAGMELTRVCVSDTVDALLHGGGCNASTSADASACMT